MQNLEWFSVPRIKTPTVVHGFAVPDITVSRGGLGTACADGLVVGFAGAPKINSAPVVGLLDQSSSADFFAWLSTYAPEAFPVSQSIRVLSLSDWDNGVNALAPRTQFLKDAVWPSLIVGEILGQGERELDVASLPLSRVFATFTYAQARAALLYGESASLTRECRNRLLLVEADSAFVKRPIGVSDLALMWEFVEHSQDAERRQIIKLVGNIIASEGLNRTESLPVVFRSVNLNLEKLATGPLEQRVVEFERATKVLLESGRRGPNEALALAALAMLVGGSTTHVSLLDEFAAEFPTTFAWFGLLAGMVGSEAWDEKWLRFSTSVERLLRSSLSLEDPPTADLCWIEYNWIRGLRQSAIWLKETPKLYPRVLSIEILPGANCQLRLIDNSQAPTKGSLVVSTVPVATSTAAVPDAERLRRSELISSMKADLKRVADMLGHFSVGEPQIQSDFFLTDDKSSKETLESKRKRPPARKTTKPKVAKKSTQ